MQKATIQLETLKNKLLFLDKNSRVHDNIDEVFKRKLDLGKNKGE